MEQGILSYDEKKNNDLEAKQLLGKSKCSRTDLVTSDNVSACENRFSSVRLKEDISSEIKLNGDGDSLPDISDSEKNAAHSGLLGDFSNSLTAGEANVKTVSSRGEIFALELIDGGYIEAVNSNGNTCATQVQSLDDLKHTATELTSLDPVDFCEISLKIKGHTPDRHFEGDASEEHVEFLDDSDSETNSINPMDICEISFHCEDDILPGSSVNDACSAQWKSLDDFNNVPTNSSPYSQTAVCEISLRNASLIHEISESKLNGISYLFAENYDEMNQTRFYCSTPMSLSNSKCPPPSGHQNHNSLPEVDEVTRKRHPCSWPQCDLVFSSKWHLSRHFKIHSGDRSFKCDVCNRTFNRKDKLTDHQRTQTHKKNSKKVQKND